MRRAIFKKNEKQNYIYIYSELTASYKPWKGFSKFGLVAMSLGLGVSDVTAMLAFPERIASDSRTTVMSLCISGLNLLTKHTRIITFFSHLMRYTITVTQNL